MEMRFQCGTILAAALAVGAAMADPAAACAEAAKCRLPGEDGTKAALPPAPFPDRISAYVWRNWGLVEKERLAKVVGATAEELTAVAEQMGLEADPAVLPEWKKKGYITVVRRNWHLLPYDQMLTLLGKTREELRFSLMEDDFLWHKLGCMKPKCEPLRWDSAMKEGGRAGREAIARILKEEGLDPRAAEEPRFSFVGGIARADPGFQMPGKSDSPFDFRLIFSYFADYGDPLADPEIGSFPEGLLQKLAAEGVNAVWMHTVLRTLAKDPKYPEFGDGSEMRIANLRKLVARCGKYGIRVFLYMNEPRAMPAEFFAARAGRSAFKGADDGVQFAMCTSHPEVRRWVRDALEQVFSQVPGLGGIFTITMSENLTNCASRWHRERCPRCKGRSVGDIVAEINNAMVEGMAAGSPDAVALIWNWQWPKDEEGAIVAALPQHNCRLMAVSENGIPICRGGVDEREDDYSISIVGPGENALRLWGFARERKIPAVAKVQAANSWELSSFPYLPTMDLVAQHAVNLANAGIDGVMLSWSLGCCPSPNLSVYRDLRRGERDKEGVLDRLAERLYGKGNVAKVRRAWKAFSDGFANYPFSCQTIYNGPHQWGPANPLYLQKTGYRSTMVGIPYDDLDGWRKKYPRETYAELIGRVADGFAEGCRLMEGVAEKRELDMFRAEQMHFASCRDQALFVMARDCGDGDEMRRLAKAELERAKAYWPIVRADSRIGYESSNHYFFTPRDVLEKVLSCRAVLDLAETDFTPLFNGRDFSGWAGGVTNGTYVVEGDGSVKCVGGLGWKWPQPRNIWTAREYTNFVLRFECRLSARANNGIGIRAPGADYVTSSGMEIQILEDESTDFFQRVRNIKDYSLNGSIYGIAAARRQSRAKGYLRPLGEWNSYEIRADGSKVSVTLNGEKVVDVDLAAISPKGGTPDGKPHPGIRNAGGHICLCWHNDVVWFRNMRIKEL